ncbi:hypothetical protein ACI65C_008703 [Semiaphis heraclei]
MANFTHHNYKIINMAQVFKLFCFAISVLLLLELADAANTNGADTSNKTTKNKGGKAYLNVKKKIGAGLTTSKNMAGIVKDVGKKVMSDTYRSVSSMWSKGKKEMAGIVKDIAGNTFSNMYDTAALMWRKDKKADTSNKTTKKKGGKAYLNVKKKIGAGLTTSKQLAGNVKVIAGNIFSNMYETTALMWRKNKTK